MIDVLVLGASGMLGSMITDFISRDSALKITATVRSKDIMGRGSRLLPEVDWKQLDAFEADLPQALDVIDGHKWVINCIGITKPLINDDNPFEVERAIRINSLFPHVLALKAEIVGAKVLQIATDCVYSGQKGEYIESDNYDALDVYGKTKSLGEVRRECTAHLRCSIIGPEPKDFKFLLEWFKHLPECTQVSGYSNHLWNGVTTLHFAKIVHGIIKSGINVPNVQHLIPMKRISKAEMLKVFGRVYDRPDVQINDVAAPQEIDRTLNTNNLNLNRQLWELAGYDLPPTVPEMIIELSQYNFRLEDQL